MHVNTFLHWCDLGEETANIEEGLHIASAENGSKALAGSGQVR